jgi:hypothetical protein
MNRGIVKGQHDGDENCEYTHIAAYGNCIDISMAAEPIRARFHQTGQRSLIVIISDLHIKGPVCPFGRCVSCSNLQFTRPAVSWRVLQRALCAPSDVRATVLQRKIN